MNSMIDAYRKASQDQAIFLAFGGKKELQEGFISSVKEKIGAFAKRNPKTAIFLSSGAAAIGTSLVANALVGVATIMTNLIMKEFDYHTKGGSSRELHDLLFTIGKNEEDEYFNDAASKWLHDNVTDGEPFGPKQRKLRDILSQPENKNKIILIVEKMLREQAIKKNPYVHDFSGPKMLESGMDLDEVEKDPAPEKERLTDGKKITKKKLEFKEGVTGALIGITASPFVSALLPNDFDPDLGKFTLASSWIGHFSEEAIKAYLKRKNGKEPTKDQVKKQLKISNGRKKEGTTGALAGATAVSMLKNKNLIEIMLGTWAGHISEEAIISAYNFLKKKYGKDPTKEQLKEKLESSRKKESVPMKESYAFTVACNNLLREHFYGSLRESISLDHPTNVDIVSLENIFKIVDSIGRGMAVPSGLHTMQYMDIIRAAKDRMLSFEDPGLNEAAALMLDGRYVDSKAKIKKALDTAKKNLISNVAKEDAKIFKPVTKVADKVNKMKEYRVKDKENRKVNRQISNILAGKASPLGLQNVSKKESGELSEARRFLDPYKQVPFGFRGGEINALPSLLPK